LDKQSESLNQVKQDLADVRKKRTETFMNFFNKVC